MNFAAPVNYKKLIFGVCVKSSLGPSLLQKCQKIVNLCCQYGFCVSNLVTFIVF